jgi:hypothetical protein
MATPSIVKEVKTQYKRRKRSKTLVGKVCMKNIKKILKRGQLSNEGMRETSSKCTTIVKVSVSNPDPHRSAFNYFPGSVSAFRSKKSLNEDKNAARKDT